MHVQQCLGIRVFIVLSLAMFCFVLLGISMCCYVMQFVFQRIGSFVSWLGLVSCFASFTTLQPQTAHASVWWPLGILCPLDSLRQSIIIEHPGVIYLLTLNLLASYSLILTELRGDNLLSRGASPSLLMCQHVAQSL